MSDLENVGVVIIGRNEGERLKRCIESILVDANSIVYVDSGSTDGSVDWVKSKGVSLVSLDMAQPFTAARARNEGFAQLRRASPNVEFVQFVDGDCELDQAWLNTAKEFLSSNASVAVVCGRRRERYPDASIYNALCDIEWDSPIGEARACGGDSLMRAYVLDRVGGFRSDVIAGEEPELCVRIRAAGWKIWRVDAEMTMHDAAMTHFGQWWKRMRRGGYAYALGASLHGGRAERFRVRETLRIVFWAGFIPVFSILAALFSPYFLLLLLIYPLQILRMWLNAPIDIAANKKAQWSLFSVLGKFPEFSGVVGFLIDRMRSRQAKIIEYK